MVDATVHGVEVSDGIVFLCIPTISIR